MDIFDYWRLNEDFSLPEVAMLMLGINPQDLERLYSYQKKIDQFREDQNASDAGFDVDLVQPCKPDYDKDPTEWKERYELVLKTLSKAILCGRLKAEKKMVTVQDWDSSMGECNYEKDTDEIDVEKTMVHLEDLQDWLKSRGICTGFFFLDSKTSAIPEYLNPNHDCYAPKLAAAVSAWLAVTGNPELQKNKNPKPAIDIWLRKNADMYGLTKDDGNPNELGIKEISKVANWKFSGASKTEA